jgi:hypothetical protein
VLLQLDMRCVVDTHSIAAHQIGSSVTATSDFCLLLVIVERKEARSKKKQAAGTTTILERISR